MTHDGKFKGFALKRPRERERFTRHFQLDMQETIPIHSGQHLSIMSGARSYTQFPSDQRLSTQFLPGLLRGRETDLFSIESTEERTSVLVVNGYVQVPASDAQVRVPRRIPHLGQRPPASERMTDKRVPPVMDRQRSQPLGAQYTARRPKPSPHRTHFRTLARERGESPFRRCF